MEKYCNGADTLPGKGDFVAAFASTNLGDISPNTNGPVCIDTGMYAGEKWPPWKFLDSGNLLTIFLIHWHTTTAAVGQGCLVTS